MTTGTGTLTIEETFLRPQALPPPPTRHALFAILIALAGLTKGPHGLILTATTFAVLAVCYHEARMRFRSLLWWPYLLLFLAMIGPWYIWIEIRFDGSFHRFF